MYKMDNSVLKWVIKYTRKHFIMARSIQNSIRRYQLEKESDGGIYRAKTVKECGRFGG